MSERYDRLLADLAAETAAFDEVLATLSDDQLGLASAAEGWSIGDQVAHLAGFDEAGAQAATDPDAFVAELERLVANGGDPIEGYRQRGRGLSAADLRDWWHDSRSALLSALAELDEKQRVPWYGPSMSAMSHGTARLMETWAHGLDVRDVVGWQPSVSDRLRHVAHLGIGARSFSYLNRGLEPPSEPILVELTSPSGERWVWGPDDAEDRVSGAAIDFCLLVTQRRHRDDVELVVTGAMATEWVEIAQAFAGAPGGGRPPLA